MKSSIKHVWILSTAFQEPQGQIYSGGSLKSVKDNEKGVDCYIAGILPTALLRKLNENVASRTNSRELSN